MNTSRKLFLQASAKAKRIVAKTSNMPAALAWGEVARLCAHAEDALRDELASFPTFTRMENNFLLAITNLRFDAKAHIETINR